MKGYKEPEMQIIDISATDVITTSGTGIGGNGEFGGTGNDD